MGQSPPPSDNPPNGARVSLAPFVIGWEEWIALPDLGLPAIKAKVDTGARTSALHAFLIERFGPLSAPMVRFGVHPVHGRDDIAVYCTAAISDRRDVTSSNGEKETRTFIKSALVMGARRWTIEIGLTNRENMSYRMLLGRQAIADDLMIDPAASFRQPKLSYRLYRHIPRSRRRSEGVDRALRLLVLDSSPDGPSSRRIASVARARGHVVDCLAPADMALRFDDFAPRVLHKGTPLEPYSAVIPRLSSADGKFGAAVVRQFELAGSHAINAGDALDRRANALALAQALSGAGIAHSIGESAADMPAPFARPHRQISTIGDTVRFLMVGGRPIAALGPGAGAAHDATGPDIKLDVHGRRLTDERGLAEKAAAVLGLGLAAIDVETGDGPARVTAISARPALARFRKITGVDAAVAIIEMVESRVGASRASSTAADRG